MGYSEAMEAAGAEVHEYIEFGSYQGEWWADVTYNGERGFAHGSYGSCSGCDAFEAEIGYSSGECDEHKYKYPAPENCPACDEAKEAVSRRLAEFGKGYLEGNLLTKEEAIKEATRYEWDSEAPAMKKWIEERGL